MLRNLLLLLCVICAVNSIAQDKKSIPSKTTEKKNDLAIDYKAMGAPMPLLTVIPFYDSADKRKDRKTLLNNSDFDNNTSMLVMMFNPTCSHCQEQTIRIEKEIEFFSKYNVLLLANKTMKPYLHDFITYVHVDQYPSIIMGIDSTDFISTVFLYQSLPQINIYNKERKLVKTYTGEVPIDSVKKYMLQ